MRSAKLPPRVVTFSNRSPTVLPLTVTSGLFAAPTMLPGPATIQLTGHAEAVPPVTVASKTGVSIRWMRAGFRTGSVPPPGEMVKVSRPPDHLIRRAVGGAYLRWRKRARVFYWAACILALSSFAAVSNFCRTKSSFSARLERCSALRTCGSLVLARASAASTLTPK